MADTQTLFADDLAADVQTIRGTITQIHYHNNGFVIAKIIVDASSKIGPDGKRPPTMKVLGSMIEPQLHQLYEFTGKVEFNQQYCSHDVRFESYRTILPTDNDGIFSYLVDTARWVGPAHAKALIDAFGSDTLEVIKHETDKVIDLGVAGLTGERIREMADSLRKNEKLEAATLEVNNLLSGVLGPSIVRRAVRLWGCDAGTVLRNNPYELTRLHGAGFLSADTLHKKLGRDPAEMPRHVAAVAHILSEAAGRDGHTYLPQTKVVEEGRKLVGGLRPDVFDAMEASELAGSDGLTVALAELSGSEKYIANKLLAMMAMHEEGQRSFPEISTDGLAEDQAAAVADFRYSRVFALVGAPGTGKTYTVARIVQTLERAGLRVSLAAPTGKAAKQMTLALSATCGGSAVTIHSLLEPSVDEETGEFSFGRGETNPLDCDCLVVDETSMVDCRLMRSLLKAVPDTARLLLVGDPYQLPSVGPGAVLRDLLRAGVPAFELKQIKRNAGDLVRACHAIKDGHSPKAFASGKLDLEAGHNWRHIEVSGPAEIHAVVEILVRDKLAALGLNLLWDVQTVSPTNERGQLSCKALNDLLRPILNPAHKPEGKLPFSVGDKVVRTKNANVKGEVLSTLGDEDDADEVGVANASNVGPDKIRIVNGDIGILREINAKEIVVDLKYPARRAYLKRAEHELKLAYCMTCHKLQGSESPVIILPVHGSYARMPMVTREWIYTAMSRAKQFLITVGDLGAVDSIVPRIGMHQRNTTLHRLLAGAMRKDVDL